MEISTVWRQVVTGDGGYGLNGSHPLPSGGGARGRLPPSGDRWLRATGGDGVNRSHPLPSGGGVAREASTVWRQVATGSTG